MLFGVHIDQPSNDEEAADIGEIARRVSNAARHSLIAVPSH